MKIKKWREQAGGRDVGQGLEILPLYRIPTVHRMSIYFPNSLSPYLLPYNYKLYIYLNKK